MEPIESIQACAERLDGVFTLADLRVLFADRSEIALFKKLEAEVRQGALVKVKAGVYALPGASLPAVSQRLMPRSYVSMGTVLAEALAIGSVPARRVQAVKVGRPQVYRSAIGVVEHLSVKPDFFFGYEPRNGALMATPEKAFIDVCYFLFKGHSFSFDPVADVDLDVLDGGRIRDYLARYDSRFIRFVETGWGL
jgi:hypothetical protein